MLDKKIILLISLILASFVYASVSDSDLDGVPDENDKCSGSKTTIVDINGCSCEQKNCIDHGDECTILCGEQAGEAVCNLWDYEKCGFELEEDLDLSIGDVIDDELVDDIILDEELQDDFVPNDEILDLGVPPNPIIPGVGLQDESVPEDSSKENIVSDKEQFSEEESNVPDIIAVTLGLAIFGIGVPVFLWMQNKDKKQRGILTNYLESNLNKGYPSQILKQQLLNHGWDHDSVDKAFEDLIKRKF